MTRTLMLEESNLADMLGRELGLGPGSGGWGL